MYNPNRTYSMKYLMALFVIGFSHPCFSQVSATAEIETTITVIDPIKLTKSVDLNFGNVVSSYNEASVTLTPNGVRTANGLQLSNTFQGEVSPAEAIVTHGNHSYSISLPQAFSLLNQEFPSESLLIDKFNAQTFPSSESGTSDILKIGATIHLEANQKAGIYTNPSGFNITVTYN
jgi:hypothetical protein